MLPIKAVMTSAVMLGLFAMVGTGMVTGINEATKEQIAENIRQGTLKSLNEALSPDEYDNDLLSDIIEISDAELSRKKPAIAHIARKNGETVAVLFEVSTLKGYSGFISVLVGVYADGRISGVRILQQKETPGLGDIIHQSKSDWVLGFEGKSIGAPPEKRWAVKKDGGEFDQFTGATVSPRAVVGLVKNTLLYFEAHRDTLLRPVESDS